uniref:ER membrane protein complex subunit 4 n=1 Tax=Polytomella parva TaxID=51329 RepID=A0A7S0YL83_9CHLO
MSDIRSWKLNFDSLSPDRKPNLDPPGSDSNITKDPVLYLTGSKKKDVNMASRKQQMLFAQATSPLKQVGMMCFMAYMFIGNSVQIFSIMMVLGLVASPITSIVNSGKVFVKDPAFPQLDVITPRLIYCLVFAGQFLFGLYKLNAMGLLPAHPSDWISTVPTPPSLEYSYGAL